MISKIAFLLCTALTISVPSRNNITLIDVDANVDGVVLDRLDPGVKKAQNRYFESQISKLAIQYFQEELAESKDIKLSLDKSLETHISFDDQGFPNPLVIQSAIKKLNKNNIQLSPYIQLITNVRIEGDALGKNDMLQRIQPSIQVVLKLFDQDGKLSTKSMATSVFDDFISTDEFGEYGFSKSRQDHIDVLLTKINDLLEESIVRATKKLDL